MQPIGSVNAKDLDDDEVNIVILPHNGIAMELTKGNNAKKAAKKISSGKIHFLSFSLLCIQKHSGLNKIDVFEWISD